MGKLTISMAIFNQAGVIIISSGTSLGYVFRTGGGYDKKSSAWEVSTWWHPPTKAPCTSSPFVVGTPGPQGAGLTGKGKTEKKKIEILNVSKC